MNDKQQVKPLWRKIGSHIRQSALSGLSRGYAQIGKDLAADEQLANRDYIMDKQRRDTMSKSAKAFIKSRSEIAGALETLMREIQGLENQGWNITTEENPSDVKVVNYGHVIELRKEVITPYGPRSMGYFIDTRNGEVLQYGP